MRPVQRAVTFRSPRAAIPRAGRAAHFELPRDTGSPSAPHAGATSTESTQGRKENTQNKPYLHPKSAAPRPDEGTRLPQRPRHAESGTAPSPSAARFRAGCPGTGLKPLHLGGVTPARKSTGGHALQEKRLWRGRIRPSPVLCPTYRRLPPCPEPCLQVGGGTSPAKTAWQLPTAGGG